MKNIELLNIQSVLSNIPLVYEGRELPSRLQAKLMLMRVSCEKALAAIEEKLQEVRNKLKPEGFDEMEDSVKSILLVESRMQKAESWDGTGERPEAPTEEEVKEAARNREKTMGIYQGMLKELNGKWVEARRMAYEETSDAPVRKLTEDEYVSIVEMIRADGDMPFMEETGKQVSVPKAEFLSVVAATLVE